MLGQSGVEFSKKIRWRMEHDRNPLLPKLQDKFRVREYADAKQVKTPELLHVTTDADSIPFDHLPNRYFIKANHGWQWNILCYDSRFYQFKSGQHVVNSDGSFLNLETASKYEISQADVKRQCWEWLQSKHRPDEWAYSEISPVILIERMLEPRSGTDLKDYRFYTFHGKVRAINIGSALYRKNRENVFFDRAWNVVELTQYKEKLPDVIPPRPEVLSDMIEAAERLGEDVDFARMDLYDSSEGVMLGEVTIYPDAGNPKAPTTCPVFNTWLGDQWVK